MAAGNAERYAGEMLTQLHVRGGQAAVDAVNGTPVLEQAMARASGRIFLNIVNCCLNLQFSLPQHYSQGEAR